MLILIVIGIALLVTQGIWVPKLVDKIISSENTNQPLPASVKNNPNSIDISAWKTFTDPANNFSFKYPEKLSTTFISTVDWPPKVQIQNGSFTCTPAGSEIARAGQTSLKVIDGKNYCVTIETEGAAGSIYSNYAYETAMLGKLYFFTFSLRYVQCANYPEPNKTACEKERTEFTIDPIISQVIQSVQPL